MLLSEHVFTRILECGRQHDQDLLTDEIAKLVASGGTGKKRKAKVLSDDEEDPIEVDEELKTGTAMMTTQYIEDGYAC